MSLISIQMLNDARCEEAATSGALAAPPSSSTASSTRGGCRWIRLASSLSHTETRKISDSTLKAEGVCPRHGLAGKLTRRAAEQEGTGGVADSSATTLVGVYP